MSGGCNGVVVHNPSQSYHGHARNHIGASCFSEPCVLQGVCDPNSSDPALFADVLVSPRLEAKETEFHHTAFPSKNISFDMDSANRIKFVPGMSGVCGPGVVTDGSTEQLSNQARLVHPQGYPASIQLDACPDGAEHFPNPVDLQCARQLRYEVHQYQDRPIDKGSFAVSYTHLTLPTNREV